MAESSSQSSRYVYLSIADAKKTSKMRVNIFGKITQVGTREKSRGTDFVLVLRVVDQSCPLPGMSVTIFERKLDDLPNVKSVGDLISLHQIEMKVYNGEVYGCFLKAFSSFALYDGKFNKELNPYQTSSKHHAADSVDEMLRRLRTMSLEHQSDAAHNLPLMVESSSRSPSYVYCSIADAKRSLKMKVNIFAKITEVGFPNKTKGTDYALVLRVVDQSCPPPGISVTFFAAKQNNLPNVKSVGDLISLHHIEMKIHNGEVYGCFLKFFSSFALYNGRDNKELNPYLASPKHYAADHVCDMLQQLRSMSIEHQSDAGSITRLSLLRNIEIDRTFDIVCKVLHVCEIARDEWLLFIWDGTDSPPTIFQTCLDAEKENPTPLYLEPVSLSNEILRSFPREGTIFRIYADKFFTDIYKVRDSTRWVKLCNVTCKLQSGMWKGVLNSSSKVFMLSDEDDKIKYRKRIYAERCSFELERMPMTCFPEPSYITDTDHKYAAYATLMDSITRLEAAHKMKCIVRVVASCPWHGNDLCSPIDGHYRIRLTLEDPTARIHAYINKENGEKFFGGNLMPDELNRKMSKLLGIQEDGTQEDSCTSRNPPWIWCCLKSYYLDANNPWGSRRYMIFDTWLVD